MRLLLIKVLKLHIRMNTFFFETIQTLSDILDVVESDKK